MVPWGETLATSPPKTCGCGFDCTAEIAALSETENAIMTDNNRVHGQTTETNPNGWQIVDTSVENDSDDDPGFKLLSDSELRWDFERAQFTDEEWEQLTGERDNYTPKIH